MHVQWSIYRPSRILSGFYGYMSLHTKILFKTLGRSISISCKWQYTVIYLVHLYLVLSAKYITEYICADD